VGQASSLPVDGASLPPDSAGKPSVPRFRFKPTRREKYFLMTLAVLGVGAATLWRPIQHRWLTWLVLRAEAPAQSLVDSLAVRDADPGALLNRLWSTEKIPHRLAVLDYLQSHRASGNALRIEEVAILRDAARGGDLEAKEKAFALLAARRHPELRGLALEQLRDIDPAVRTLGLQQLARSGDRQLVPLVIPFLSDPDPRVAAAAGYALGKWTSNDFGFRLSLALPDFKREASSNADTASLSQAVARWNDWWKEQGETENRRNGETAIVSDSPSLAGSAWRLPTSDFSLQDLTGNQVRLSSFRGKTVLLSFWATTATNGLSFLSKLADVQRNNADRFVILGISLDGTPLANTEGCGDEDEHSGHGHGVAHAAHVHAGHIRGQVEQFVQQHGITYPVLIDETGDLGHRFSALELPTNVVIDRDGNVRRRFVGPRSSAVVEAMLAAADQTETGLQP
jgi:peroxiredoxin